MPQPLSRNPAMFLVLNHKLNERLAYAASPVEITQLWQAKLKLREEWLR